MIISLKTKVTAITIAVLMALAMMPFIADTSSAASTDTNPVINEDTLSWDAINNADYYNVFVENYGFYVAPSETSYPRAELDTYIDYLIINNDIVKSEENTYSIRVEAFDENGNTIANGETYYSYASSAIPVKTGAITGLKINKATKTATWNAYKDNTHAVMGYVFEISGQKYGSARSTTNPKFSYSEMLADLKSKNKFTNNSVVEVKVFAYTEIDGIEEEITIGTITKKLKYSDLVKLANPLKVSGKTAIVKYSALKKRTQTRKRAKVLAVSNNRGKVTYTKYGGSKKITINKTTGKVTIKKGLKKGLYKVKVKVKAAGNANYNAITKKVTFKIKVR